MIGVIADPAEHSAVREFFELFKTPWEFYRGDRDYDVVICAGDGQVERAAKLSIFFNGRRTRFDDEQKIATGRQLRQARILSFRGNRIPIYGDTITFVHGSTLVTDQGSQECAAHVEQDGETHWARIGYDLFAEVRRLLMFGQPPANASIPTLEVHISLLRTLMLESGISFVEIPPIPEGFQFVACLTHDVDHPSIRQHNWDYTAGGFLLRAVFGSLIDTVRGRMSIRDAGKNWVAAVKLPFVYIGIAKDFWRDFDDRYLELEKDAPSTFFVVPRKNYPGKRLSGSAPALRAVRYEAEELADTIRKLTASGHEVGLHGIDAWLESSTAHEELGMVGRLTGASEIGVRMHWLYYNEKSPAALEKAGAVYDSTIGYNETVGYRAGTTQVYKPLEVERLLELPMHAMDTALFYLSYLGLSPQKASSRLRQLADTTVEYGGCLTINWHDRSLAPERLWDGCYRDLIEDLRSRGAWFSTASQAVSWFRKRRSAIFEIDCSEPGGVRAKVTIDHGDKLPGLRLRIHKARGLGEVGAHCLGQHVDIGVSGSAGATVLV